MFTGIIEEIGTVKSLKHSGRCAEIRIMTEKILSDIHIGDSIAVNGLCLTVREFDRCSFSSDIMPESLNRSALGKLSRGDKVNLERAMQVGMRFGGHIVTGHIDGTGVINNIRKDQNAIWYTIKTSNKILRYIIEKGSVAVDGISLTAAAVGNTEFSVSVIPHTAENTALLYKKTGSVVNLENDCVGKYIEKLTKKDLGITQELLKKYEF